MKGKIACSADRLSLLDPTMIQSVVEAQAFNIGKQYSSDNRVRITEANEIHLTSAVMGKSGLYEQSIQLKDGYLDARCTCTLAEQPLCRHGVAALLEYHRWSKSYSAPSTHEPKTASSPSAASVKVMPPQSADVKLSDLTVFIEWMQQAVRAIEQDAPVPGQPASATGEVASWMRLIRHLDDGRRHGEEIQLGLQANLHSREAALAGLTQQLDSSMNEAKSIQATCRDLRREIASYKSQLGKAGELAEQFDELDAEVKAMVGDLSEKSDKLASLAAALQQAVVALRAMDARDPNNK